MAQPFSDTLIVRTLRRLHADRTADMIQKILIIACIALPILVLLLAFRKTITEWFNDQQQEVESNR